MTTELPQESRKLGRPLLSPGARVFVAGHRGLVGSALARRLTADGHEVVTRGRDELDLRDVAATGRFLRDVRPDAVVLAAAKVGGIMANSTWPVQFLEDNLRIQLSVIAGAHAAGTPRLLFLGSSCIYPRRAPQPIREDSLLTGPLEPTNEAYALAKIAGIVQTQSYRRQYGASYISAMPTNLYGPGDNFDLETSHVLPALIRRFHEARRERAPEVTLWGSGSPRREFLHVDDLAAACVRLLEAYDGDEPVNIGCGVDLTIRELAETVREVTGYQGRIAWDASKPDGTPRKLLDVSRLTSLGFTPRIPLRDGIARTYAWWLGQPAARG
ncbi:MULTISPECIES: GDP-L-fucose synthase [unclassified Streptomyces]|uniref:GDP-L-fucose synthase family protein n=1 Tax=unclassified Streptomyces TaxID=2593676 RepID=UPI0001C18AA4|nr:MULTISPECIES: GDP-L-fucose synthase [unclassified Streptomyces]AEN12955.1 NAD-dependent epimerase/dehydratase [Streptomyces sp. SirexAA-E]MYR66051.1 NAD-dependent epimerase/dehydratase family protein [Streptomyces sp. SID4939]MYS01015.1 NAD-dependent epimerase/dehydratase family protein [Streptomyces sp. SID4940]MYT65824.1 NAD-dependent epimerase/dehydratase family protein [Streptomyces sp. SID8357]MYT84140.1 NAD-dependent epimerase/dehydratase family protein [Streptomyces sp. SID8360]